MMALTHLHRLGGLAGCLVILAGCAATTTAISKRNLDVQTKMSDSIFLDPVAPDERTVFVQVRNTSDKPDFDIEPQVRSAIEQRGFSIVDDPEQATYLLQANVLQAGKNTKSAAEHAALGGFGSILIGGAAGAAAGRVIAGGNGSVTEMVIGGLIGAAAAATADAFVQDVTFTIITDLQVSERANGSVVVTERTSQELQQGSSGTRKITATETTEWKRYQTRVVSTAEKVNLDFEEASPDLVSGMTRSIAGIF